MLSKLQNPNKKPSNNLQPSSLSSTRQFVNRETSSLTSGPIIPRQSQSRKKSQQDNLLPTKRTIAIADRTTPPLYVKESSFLGREESSGLRLENYPYPLYSKNIFGLDWDECKPLLKGYSDFYLTEDFTNFVTEDAQLMLTIGSILSNGKLTGILPEIRERLSALSLLIKAEENDCEKLFCPLLFEDDFEILDEFRWFAHDNEIKAKLQCIDKICELMSINTELSYKKFQKFGDTPNVHLNKLNKGTLKKVNSICESEKSTSNVICISNDYELSNIKDRLAMKHLALTHFAEQKNPLLQELEQNANLFKGFHYIKKLYPNKVQAYIIFELMLNQALLISSFYAKHKENPFFDKVFEETLHTTYVLVQFVELLLPYAIEITKSCGIDLENNEDLQEIRKIKELLLEKLHEEYKVYEQYAAESLSIEKNANKMPHRKKPETQELATKENKEEVIDKEAIIEPTLEEEKMRELTKAENEAFLRAKKLQAEQTEKMRKLAREQKKISKEKAESMVKNLKAQNIVSQHKTEETEKEEKEQKERLNLQIKIHDLPTNEFVQTKIIDSLKGDKLTHFEMLFELIENDNKMNDEGVLNLTKHMQTVLFENEIGCGNDLLLEVKARIHHRHDSDTGDLLPKYYVSILRTCFIIFGIFPKDWEPQTKKDFNAMIKYNNRLIAKLAFASKIV